MSRTIERRLTRLEQEAGITDDDYELIESEFSDETKDLMPEAMRVLGTLSPEEIEAQVSRRWHEPSARQLSPEGQAILDDWQKARLAGLGLRAEDG
jgi:hypothetical protein